MPEFEKFPKMGRYSRTVIVTEKIDGTNAQVCIEECEGYPAEDAVFQKDGLALFAGSRKRWITPENDNAGFARWCKENGEKLLDLGPGRHFGEWWGAGIQRKYGLINGEKRFSLFNAARWCLSTDVPQQMFSADPRIVKMQDVVPECCSIVPILWTGMFDDLNVDSLLQSLEEDGSFASPGFMNPEGIVIYHVAGNVGFKKTLKGDGMPKSIYNKQQKEGTK